MDATIVLNAETTIEDGFVMVNSNDIGKISQFVDDLSRDLRQVSLEIHDNPELMFEEFHAHKVLTEYLQKQQGWKVTPSAYNIETAFVAVFDSGKNGPTVSFNAEYDALKGIGHACGHNLIAIASLGGALAAAKTMQKVSYGGKVILFGTPAEEGGGGKIKMLEAGAYEDVDISLISHPGITPDTALMRTSAYASFKVEYFGKEAHAAASPWEGINALDALITAYNAISVLRQQTQTGDIIQGQITNGGLRPNIIHAYSSGMFVVRSSNRDRLDALKARVLRCFEAGATATGATLKITPKMSYDDHCPNKTLASRFRLAFNELSPPHKILPEDLDFINGVTQASTDQGNISYSMPSISPQFSIKSKDANGQLGGGPHTPDFERAARTEEAHDNALRVAKALAATAVDVLASPELLQAIKHEFKDMTRQTRQTLVA